MNKAQAKNLSVFQKAYQQLNPLQKQAVDHIDQGPLLVIAGPGTGKTQTLALRIANILLKTDAKPENILAITFTDVAAKNMRERLLKIIGKEAYYLQIHTFHSYCSQLMSNYPEYFPLKNNSQVLGDLERYQIFENLIEQLKPKHLRPLNDHFHYLKAIISAISDLKRENISILEFEEMLKAEAQQLIELEATTKSQVKIKKATKDLNKNKDLILIYQAYQQELLNSNSYDFDDMINFVIDAFDTYPELLLEQQEQLQHFLVDEYQDSNNSQTRLLNLLASYWPKQGLEPDVFVLGDPNQAIYRFQGASVENVLAFTRQYPNATVITLDTAYRCPQNIYDTARDLIKNNQLSFAAQEHLPIDLAAQLHSPKGQGDKIVLYQAPSASMEIIYIAEEIKKLLKTGVKAQEIVVLYRTHAESTALIEVLNKWQINYQLNKGDDILQSPLIQQLLMLMELVEQFQHGLEMDNLYQVMMLPFVNLDSILVMKLARVAGQISRIKRESISLYQVYGLGLAEINQHLTGQEITEEQWSSLEDFFAKLAKLAVYSQQLTLTAWFEKLISDEACNLSAYLKDRADKINSLLELNTLFKQIKDLTARDHQLSLKKFLDYFATYREHQLSIRLQNPLPAEEAVQLSTAHGAKGMEWEYVFVLDFIDGKWGNVRNKNKLKLPEGILKNTDLSSKERNEDERRLFYVVLTRAKKRVYLSYPELLESNLSSSNKVPSIFLSELSEKELDRVNPNLAKEMESHLSTLLMPSARSPITLYEKDFYSYLIKDFSLSVTALNNYLKDPQDFVTNNLLKLPTAKKVFMCFGTAVHSALERFYRFYQQQNQYPSLDVFLANFTQALDQEIMSESDFKDRLSYGQEVLSQYYQELIQEKPRVLAVEQSFGGQNRRIMLGDIRLTGKIDRLDYLDQKQGLVKVIDYKTGRSKSLNEIIVNTKTTKQNLNERELNLPATIRGNYQRQLVFYKLLMQLDRQFSGKIEVAEAAFHFVEPTEKGGKKFVNRSLAVSDEAIADLKQLIKEVMAEIRSLKFLDSLDF
ncbi:MAG: ATP-dependent helicase [Candidatus Pacebacteria bacterium]|nr:ATP-dependent helicase [Candidatus Paceibacterota bacterium]